MKIISSSGCTLDLWDSCLLDRPVDPPHPPTQSQYVLFHSPREWFCQSCLQSTSVFKSQQKENCAKNVPECIISSLAEHMRSHLFSFCYKKKKRTAAVQGRGFITHLQFFTHVYDLILGVFRGLCCLPCLVILYVYAFACALPAVKLHFSYL